ncbi:NADH dehydrogenase [ubiquinone] 1 alpha subcomplex subunit 11 [Nymphon striatum]|nr:NADH dehydrogenase [ubiquinone] 1 alpha subcomplex subunit 11 [Nymphon striatum]
MDSKTESKSFHGTHDQEDFPDKLFRSTKLLTLIGLAGSSYHYVVPAPPKTKLGAVLKVSKFVLPFALAGATYSGVVYGASKIRGKDDPWNHILAGYALASVIAVRFKNPHIAIIGGTFIGLTCGFSKRFHLDGQTWLDADHCPQYGPMLASYNDYSMVQDKISKS